MNTPKLFLPLAALVFALPATSFGQVAIDYNFDGIANEVGPAVGVVDNGVDDAIAGSTNTTTGVIVTGERTGGAPYSHALGFNSSGTVDLSAFSGFTATFTVDSISLANSETIDGLLANGMFFGVVSGTNATGTGGGKS